MALNGQTVDGLNVGSLQISSSSPIPTPSRSAPPELSKPDAIVRNYLLQESSIFVAVDEVRERGWNSPEGDKVYQQKRERVMNTSKDVQWRFYHMYEKIANAMHTETGAFTIPDPDSKGIRALNLCLAPGGYTKKLLELHPTIKICGITLAESEGGHEVLAKSPRLDVKYLDMNLLAIAYGVPLSNIPSDHPDAGKFLTEAPFAGLNFDIVVGDGAVLHTHTREEYRQDKDREALRLRVAQLIFGLSRIKAGGTFIILTHRIDSWENLVLLRNFEQFSKVTVFKPTTIHTQSSSFYLIAKEVQPDHRVAKRVIQEWKKVWSITTFGGGKGTGECPEEPSTEDVVQILKHYGPRFVEMGGPVWQIQADGLSKASYMEPRPSGAPPASSESRSSQKWSRSSSNDKARNKRPEICTGAYPSLTASPKKVRGRSVPLKENRPPAASLSSWRS